MFNVRKFSNKRDSKTYYNVNKEGILKRRKNYQEEKKEKILIQKKSYYILNKERIKARVKLYQGKKCKKGEGKNCDESFSFIIIVTAVPEIWEVNKDIFVIILSSYYMSLHVRKFQILVVPGLVLFMYFPFGKPKSLPVSNYLQVELIYLVEHKLKLISFFFLLHFFLLLFNTCFHNASLYTSSVNCLIIHYRSNHAAEVIILSCQSIYK